MRVGEVIAAGSGHGTKPVAGVRILAIEQMQALPFATQLLAHLGAEVVKVEHPVDGDSGRGSLPAVRDADGRMVGATYLRNNLSKKSIAVDLKHPEGVALIKRLVPRYGQEVKDLGRGSRIQPRRGPLAPHRAGANPGNTIFLV